MIVVGWLLLYALYSVLQAALRERQDHEEQLRCYRAAVHNTEEWYDDARARNAGEPMVSYDADTLQQQLQENEVTHIAK